MFANGLIYMYNSFMYSGCIHEMSSVTALRVRLLLVSHRFFIMLSSMFTTSEPYMAEQNIQTSNSNSAVDDVSMMLIMTLNNLPDEVHLHSPNGSKWVHK